MGSRWVLIEVLWDPHGGRRSDHMLKHFPVGILRGSLGMGPSGIIRDPSGTRKNPEGIHLSRIV
eukprot:3287030-Pyramimonas_sp.AAC.1